jgi:hypothetical protein
MNYYIQGNAAKADQIKAAFKEKGFDADWCPITRELLYFTVNCRVHLTDSDSIYADIIKTHPDYKELELPKPHYDIKNFKPFDWRAYKAQVALQVIGYYVKIYESRQGNMVTDAQAQAVEAAAELAEKMERRLKQ